MSDEPLRAQGTVVRTGPTIYFVQTPYGEVVCRLRGRLKEELYEEADDGTKVQRFTNPVAVGDLVEISLYGEEGVIEEVLPRRSKFSRLTAKPHPDAPDVEQVIAANVDQVVILASVKEPPLNLRFLDRLLVLATYSELEAALVLNKADLLNARERTRLKEAMNRIYGPLRIPWLLISATTGENLDAVRELLAGKTTVLVGRSGTGKSSLLNALQPGLDLRVGEVSEHSGKGRHTTTTAALYTLDFGAKVVDTPGIREVGLWGVPTEELDYYFVEMRPYLGQCRFSDCWHFEEPGCAVREAVERGEISPERYESYRRLVQGSPVEEHERRRPRRVHRGPAVD
ncbi:MAG: putative ribosome biogenesis GTPase RsgA [Candidatus Poribacteria bacterium]|nr:MAG: putative ribosome biogenesis GTPase RsgA [Candidatus Poribacteria bacterium]